MEWIRALLPLVGVLIGWLLSESGKIFSDKRQDKRKLKKLLFFLLELRFHFARELSFELDISKYLTIMKSKLAEKFGIDKNDPELNVGMDAWKPFLLEILSKTKMPDNKFEYLSDNIDKILVELAEIFPILAHELSGQHNIKERLNNANNCFNDVEIITNQIPFNLKEWINPKLTKALLENLDVSIEKIATKIDKETLIVSTEKVLKMHVEDDEKDFNLFIDEYLNKIIESIEHEERQ